MNSKKLAIVSLVVIIFVFVGAFYLFRSNKNGNLEQFNQQRLDDLRKNNPGLLDKLTKNIQVQSELVKKDPKNFDAWMELGVSYNALGDYKKAEEAYYKAAAINEKNSVIWNNLGELYKQKADYKKAEEAFIKLVEINGTEAESYLKLAELYAAGYIGTIEDAKRILSQGILKTNSEGLKVILDKLNKEGKI